MPIRRRPTGSAPVFLTAVTWQRQPTFRSQIEAERLLTVLRIAREKKPFAMRAYVILPDHLHILIQPAENVDFTEIIGSVKANYSRLLRKEMKTSAPLRVWQDRFWDHIIRDENDLQRHLDYIHYNPVRHGYVTNPESWQATSFHIFRQRGHYAPMWGWSLPQTLEQTTGAHLEGDMDET